MTHPRILELIHTGVWAIHPNVASAYLPLVAQFEKGNFNVFAFTERETERKAYELVSAESPNGDNPTNQKVAVYTIEGVITKTDQYCGPQGVLSMIRQMRQNDKDPSVIGHILSIDSGGGEASYIQEAARIIRTDIQKPIVAHFSGVCASAAYGLASAADEIFATELTDITGSIGCVMSFADWRKAYEEQGVVFHEVYADQSTQKGAEWRDMREKNYAQLKEIWLNPMAQSFIDSVKTMRPQLSNTAEIFTGKTYNAKSAIENGMIDGTMTFEAAVNRVFEKAQKPILLTKKKTKMAFNLFGKTFGEVTKAETGEVTLTAEQWTIIESASQSTEANATLLAEQIAVLAALKEDFEIRIGALEAKPAVKPAQAVKPETQAEKPTAKDALNAKIAANLK